MMEHSKKHSEQNPLRRRFSSKFIPSEESKLALILQKIVVFWGIGKIVCVVGGFALIGWTILLFAKTYAAIPPIFVTGVTKMTASFLPFFLRLMTTSLSYLWQPILVYLLIALLTKSQVWRKFWCLVGASGFLLILVATVKHSTWKDYQMLPLLIMQGYLFMLWLLPREVWNIIGLLISLSLGLVILILPDFPSAFDDFGLFGAILVFFL